MLKKVAELLTDEHGTETVEYAILTGLVAVGLVTVLIAIGTWIHDRYEQLLTTLSEH